MDRAGIELFKLNWYRTFDGDPEQASVFNEVSAGRVPSGAEYYLPLFLAKHRPFSTTSPKTYHW